jgi:GMP synthase-like glutamine amidotransferase
MERLSFTDEFLKKKYVIKSKVFDSLEKVREGLTIMEAHGDNVSKLPEGAFVLASSRNTQIEAFGIEERVLGF